MAHVTDEQIQAIPGWFHWLDVSVFRLLLSESGTTGGDLAELGVYKGKSAVLIGAYLQAGETLTVIDLFGGQAPDTENLRENAEQYPRLTREPFENTYRAVHGALPVVLEDYSATIADHASNKEHRFVHIDASHLYEHVVADIAAAKALLKPDGIVVLDDYRNEHTPGVAAAAWEAVFAD